MWSALTWSALAWPALMWSALAWPALTGAQLSVCLRYPLLGGKLSRCKSDSGHEHKDRLPGQRTLQCRLWVPQVWSHRYSILSFFYGINFILAIAVRAVEVSHFIDEKAEVLWKGPTS